MQRNTPSKLWAIIKKVNLIFIDALNFIILLPVYFIGVGFSYLLWKLFSRKKSVESKTYWKESKKLEEKYEEYLKQY
jgi:hypothetical protein